MQPQQPLQPGQQPVPPQQPQQVPQPMPQQPAPQAPAQYDFIMNPAQPPKKSPLGGNSSRPMRILLVVGAIFVLVIVAGLGLSAVGGGGKEAAKADLTSVVQDQAELVRVSGSGLDSATSDATKNLAINTKLSLTTQQTKLTTYMSSRSIKLKDKVLALKQNGNTDTQLNNAKSASNFDPVFTGIIKQQLVTYQRDLQTAYDHSSAGGKPILQQEYNDAQLLLTQIEQSGS